VNALRHPDHDTVAREVRSWYTESYPAMGYHRERRRFGIHGRNLHLPFMGGSVILEALMVAQIPEFLVDARDYFGGAEVEVSVDDRQRDAEIGAALVAAGLARERAWSALAHVGRIPEAPPVAGLTIEPLSAADVEAFSIAKLKGFAGDEAKPAPKRLAEEMAFRRNEMADVGRGLVARIDGEIAAVLGYYEGQDRDLSILTTRVPFRGRGIARQLLRHALADAGARGCRSVVIVADEDDSPIQFYRRAGFIDELCWRRTYRLAERRA
jgi:ribosomal protein S18 acetylase RimI-like enzyme